MFLGFVVGGVVIKFKKHILQLIQVYTSLLVFPRKSNQVCLSVFWPKNMLFWLGILIVYIY